MKQSVKNVIMIGMAAVLIGTSAVTISYAGTGARMQSRPEFSQNGEQRQNGSPFESFDGERNGAPPTILRATALSRLPINRKTAAIHSSRPIIQAAALKTATLRRRTPQRKATGFRSTPRL